MEVMTRRTLINILITVFMLSFIVWIRLFAKKVPIDLNNLSFSYFTLFNVSFLIICFIFIIIFNIKKLFKIETSSMLLNTLYKFKLVKNILNIFHEIGQAPKNLYVYYEDKIKFKEMLTYTIPSYLRAYLFYPYGVVFIFIFFPQIFVATIFIIDIFIRNKIEYFYSSLVLLIIPLLLKIYTYMVNYTTTKNMKYYEAHLIFSKTMGGIKITVKPVPPEIDNPLTMDQMNEKLHVLVDLWRINREIVFYTNCIYGLEDKYEVYIRFYTVLCYLIGWLFYLWKIFLL